MLRSPIFSLYIRFYGVNRDEIVEDLGNLETINKFFTREVKQR